MYQLSKTIFVFHIDLAFFELFQFTQGTLFWTSCVLLLPHATVLPKHLKELNYLCVSRSIQS